MKPDHRGYLPIWRKFFDDHPFWKENRRFSKAEAWLDILYNTNFDEVPKQRIINGRLITVPYGHALMTTRYCGKRWGWHNSEVYRFFKLLQKMEQIAIKVEQQMSLINVINFARYDPKKNGVVNGVVNDGGTQTERKSNELNKGNKGNKGNNKIYSSDSVEIRLSKFLFSCIRKNNPNAKEPNMQTWAKHIDFMLRIDNRDIDETKSMIEWCQKDNFWQSNILSTKKLREKYDQLVSKRNAGDGGFKPFPKEVNW